MPILGQAPPPPQDHRPDNIISILSACLKGMDEELPIDAKFFDPDFWDMEKERADIARHKLKSWAIMTFALLAFAALIAWALMYPDTVLFTIGGP